MRQPANRHGLCRLRQILRLSQKDFAALIGCSSATVQSIELGRLQLSDSLAVRISDRTLVDPIWLLEGEYTRLPLNIGGGEYRYEDFITASVNREMASFGVPKDDEIFLDGFANAARDRIKVIMAGAIQAGLESLGRFRIGQALDKLESEFCQASEPSDFSKSTNEA